MNVDERGPVAAKSAPGQEALDVQARPAGRARQEIDYGRRAKAPFIAFLCWVDEQLPPDKQRSDAIVDNLGMHHCHDRLWFQIHHPRWEGVYPPTYAAYLNRIEPWGTIFRSLALTGRRCAPWEEVVGAIEAATAYGQTHKHPFVWGRRRRHRPLSSARSVSFTTKVMRI